MDELVIATQRLGPLPELPHGHTVGQEDHIKSGAFGCLRQVLKMREVQTSVGVRARMPPGRDVMAIGVQEGSQFHLCAHVYLFTPPYSDH